MTTWSFALLASILSSTPVPLPAYPSAPQQATRQQDSDMLTLSSSSPPEYFCPRCNRTMSGGETFEISITVPPAMQIRFCVRCLVDALSRLVPPMVEATR